MKVKCLNGEPHFGSKYHCTEQNSSQIHGVCPGGGEVGGGGGGGGWAVLELTGTLLPM